MPPRTDVFNALEDMVQTFRIVVHGEKAPAGEVFSSAENPRGELGFYILSGRHSPAGQSGSSCGRDRPVRER